ncbi:MAG: transglutaminase-like domain-containing protein [Thermodesulfobacteriota bacterium]
MRIRYITLCLLILLFSGCASSRVGTWIPFARKTYSDTVSGWKSYRDVVKWMEGRFSFDEERYKKYEGTLPPPRTPEETFRLRSGIYMDVAFFLKETLHRVDPSYQSRVVVIVASSSRFNHYVCSFKAEGKLFILDYGTPYKEMTGVHGPYRSLEEYRQFYEKHHPVKRKIEAITFLK